MAQEQFLYGAATSAHQVEGYNVHNDWWEWEQRRTDKEKSGAAADHYNRFREDFVLAKELGHTAHRLSLEWSRIEPQQGQWSRKAVDHYRDVLKELRNQGMKTFVTLHHFTNPVWLARDGGWLAPEAPELFARYARFVAQELGDLVDFWITINEPMVYVTKSYGEGEWPPERRNLWEVYRVTKRMAKGHRLAYRALKTVNEQIPVGMAKHMIAYLPEHVNRGLGRFLVRAQGWWFNHWFYSLTPGTHDFLGVNYYFTVKKKLQLWPPKLADVPWEGAKTDIGWPIRPEGLEHVLVELGRKYKRPIYVTENGLADEHDRQRAEFIRSHLRAVEAAQRQGADVRGYLHWSLLDNFEWAAGFWPQFGLVKVDYATMKRTVRPSAYAYKAIIEQASRL